jgi:NRPS condensation-like uncharacterized protein
MTKVTIQIDKYLFKQLKLIARQHNLTINEVIVIALKEKLKELEDDRSF